MSGPLPQVRTIQPTTRVRLGNSVSDLQSLAERMPDQGSRRMILQVCRRVRSALDVLDIDTAFQQADITEFIEAANKGMTEAYESGWKAGYQEALNDAKKELDTTKKAVKQVAQEVLGEVLKQDKEEADKASEALDERIEEQLRNLHL